MNDDDLEDRLRAALRMHAGEAPPGAALLTTVTRESTRRVRRSRLTALAAGAAALIAVGAAVPFALRGAPTTAPAEVAAPPSVVPPSSAAPATLAPSTAPATVTFPFTPTEAKGYGSPLVMLTAARPTLLQNSTSGNATLTLYSAPPPPPTAKTHRTAATVHGTPAEVYEWRWSDDDPSNPIPDLQRTLVWQPAPGSWLRLDMPSAASATDLVTYAEQVRPSPLTAQSPFTFKTMPAGWTVDNISPAAVTFCPPGVAPDPTFVDKIAVMLDDSPGTEPKYDNAIRVSTGSVKGWLSTSPEGDSLQLPQPGGRSLLLQVGPKAHLPTDVLLAFAASIAVTPAAQVSRG